MRIVKSMICLLILVSLVLLCACNEKKAYLNPYGEGVDPESITTIPYVSPTTTPTTALKLAPTTTTIATTVPTRVVLASEDQIPCPDCKGILVYCEYCKGTLRRQGEMLDPDSDIYRKYTIACNMCQDDPGFQYCHTCKNKLVISK